MVNQEKRVSDEHYQRYLSALIRGDRAECARILENENRERRPIIPLYEGLFQRSLYRMGELLEMNRISVATEPRVLKWKGYLYGLAPERTAPALG